MEYILFHGALNDDYVERLRDGQYSLNWYTHSDEWGEIGHNLCSYNLDELLNYYKDLFLHCLELQAERDGVTVDDIINGAYDYFNDHYEG